MFYIKRRNSLEVPALSVKIFNKKDSSFSKCIEIVGTKSQGA